jgi:acyl-CoA dehydrogenase
MSHSERESFVGLALNDTQKELRDQVAALLAERATADSLRSLITSDVPWDEGLWRAFAELGFLGAAIPEAYGGVGLGPTELCVIAEEVGRAVAPIPFFSSICLAAEAIHLAGSEPQKEAWLPKLASGEVIGTLAWTEGPGAPRTSGLATRFSDGRLSGSKSPVPDAAIASICVVVTSSGGRPALALLELAQPGVTIAPMTGFDQLRHHSQVDFAEAEAELLDGVDAVETLHRLQDRAAIYEAFEQVGGAESALYMARDYTMQRYIFGRPLASYQAVKHKLADILVMLELARSNALAAADALENDAPGVAVAAATARLAATRAYETAARENLQLHGGIGFTWAANCHFHYRRARLLALNLGSAEVWIDKLIAELSARNAPARAA